MAALEDWFKMLPFTVGLVRYNLHPFRRSAYRLSRVGEFLGELLLTLLQKSEYGTAAMKTVENM